LIKQFEMKILQWNDPCSCRTWYARSTAGYW